MDICAKIRRARQRGKTRCSVVDGRMTVVEAARAFGLADDSATYRSIGRTEAEEIAVHVLRADLAYSLKIMSVLRAADLWRQFMALFEGQEVEFATNVLTDPTHWMPATQATFDMGVLVIGSSKTGCLWVEDED